MISTAPATGHLTMTSTTWPGSTRDEALSPVRWGVWGLYAAGAVFAGVLVVTAAWNLAEHLDDVRRWLKL